MDTQLLGIDLASLVAATVKFAAPQEMMTSSKRKSGQAWPIHLFAVPKGKDAPREGG